MPVFLPASQVDIRKPGDISRFIGKEVQCKILKIDVENRNIVVSRRKLIEEDRTASKEKTPRPRSRSGQIRKGIVKNIADFGVFVDLGGLDGLLHISDLSWGRMSHPSEVVGHRPGDRVRRHRRGQGQREDLAGPQAKERQPVGHRGEQVPDRLPASRARSST